MEPTLRTDGKPRTSFVSPLGQRYVIYLSIDIYIYTAKLLVSLLGRLMHLG